MEFIWWALSLMKNSSSVIISEVLLNKQTGSIWTGLKPHRTSGTKGPFDTQGLVIPVWIYLIQINQINPVLSGLLFVCIGDNVRQNKCGGWCIVTNLLVQSVLVSVTCVIVAQVIVLLHPDLCCGVQSATSAFKSCIYTHYSREFAQEMRHSVTIMPHYKML